MNNIEEIYSAIDRIVEAQKKARLKNDYLTLLVNAEALLERIPQLIIYSTDQEHEYRKFEAKLADIKIDDKRQSSSYCETMAKATDNYKNWQRSKLFMELVYEYINISKKLASSVNSEFNSQ